MTELKWFNCGHPMRKKAVFFMKDTKAENRKQRKSRKCKEAVVDSKIGISLEELNRAIANKTLWT